MNSFFNDLFDYNYHCNQRIIEIALAENTIPKKTIVLFSHILNAHHRWNSVVLESSPTHEAWDVHEISKWQDLHYDNQRSTFGIITNTENFEKEVNYMNAKQESQTRSLREILFHVINHSTYHRGQIAMILRDSTIAPSPSDFIHFKN
ncbi:DinB family protein [Flavobacteriaceae bacterium M23B6Z8]